MVFRGFPLGPYTIRLYHFHHLRNKNVFAVEYQNYLARLKFDYTLILLCISLILFSIVSHYCLNVLI